MAIGEAIKHTDRVDGAIWGIMVLVSIGLPVLILIILGQQIIYWIAKRFISPQMAGRASCLPALLWLSISYMSMLSLNPREAFCKNTFSEYAMPADDIEFIWFDYSGGIDPYYCYQFRITENQFQKLITTRPYTLKYYQIEFANSERWVNPLEELSYSPQYKKSIEEKKYNPNEIELAHFDSPLFNRLREKLGDPSHIYFYSESPDTGDYYHIYYWKNKEVCVLEIINI